jgi:hypothetical protein
MEEEDVARKRSREEQEAKDADDKVTTIKCTATKYVTTCWTEK